MLLSHSIPVYIISLGCAKNLVDAERLNAALAAAGFPLALSAEDAGLVIVNTCGFITPAKEESIEVVLEALDPGLSPRRPLVAVVGCLTQRYRDEIRADIPEIDFIYGTIDEGLVPALMAALLITDRDSAADTGGTARGHGGAAFGARLPLLEGLPYAYLKIAEGCSNDCSYCAIPLIRGPHQSVPRDAVLADAAAAAGRGAREIIIVAQDITAYRHGGCDLADLVTAIAKIDGIAWIRLMYCHPDHVDERVIAALRASDKVVPYIDIPFQHASGRVLASMGRRGDAGAYLGLVARLREAVPGIRIRSTFMVGYPDEGEDEFRELMSFIAAADLDRIGAFIYSPEEGTRAAGLGDPITLHEKQRRYRLLMKRQESLSARRLEAMIGLTVPVLVEERVDEATWLGRTPYDAPEVDGIFYLTGAGLTAHSIVQARVTGATEHDLMGDTV